jgi:hypothetical protein
MTGGYARTWADEQQVIVRLRGARSTVYDMQDAVFH